MGLGGLGEWRFDVSIRHIPVIGPVQADAGVTPIEVRAHYKADFRFDGTPIDYSYTRVPYDLMFIALFYSTVLLSAFLTLLVLLCCCSLRFLVAIVRKYLHNLDIQSAVDLKHNVDLSFVVEAHWFRQARR